MREGGRFLGILLLIALLITIRALEHDLFRDSFMAFFEGEARENYLSWSLHLKTALRFFINSLLSLGILYLVFRRRSVVKFSGILFLGIFLLLFPLYVYLMGKVEPTDYLAAFYVRRFLAHPVLLLLLLPAFYYQRLKREKK